MSFFAELRRRNVIRMAGLYLVGAWLVVQVAETLLPAFGIPDWVLRAIIIVFALGFLPALAFAWVFELTPDGLKREGGAATDASIAPVTGRRMDRMIVIGLVAVIAVMAIERFWNTPDLPGTSSTQALAKPGQPATAVSDQSIAVLPFENLSSDPDNAYFATGMQDEILTRLSKISALKVTSRTSTMNIASQPANLPEIAALLGVSAILEGSVQKSGNTVRINVQLIRANTDQHLWAESYDRQLDDVFAVQGEVARAVAEALSAALTGAESEALNVAPTQNTKAYEYYLRGLALEARYAADPAEIGQRVDAYQKAVDLDPSFGLAWAYLSAAQTEIYFNNRTSEQRAVAKAALDQALRLAPEASETWAAVGIFRYYVERDYDGAFEAYSKALEIRPNNGLIVYSMGNVRRRQGHWDEALPLQQRGAEMDPLATNTWFNLGLTLRALRRYDEAHSAFDRGLAAVPDDRELLGQKFATFAAEGDLAGAQRFLDSLSAQARALPDIVQSEAELRLLERNYQAATILLEGLLDRRADLSPGEVGNVEGQLAEVQRYNGEREQAMTSMAVGRTLAQAARDRGNESPYLTITLAELSAELGDFDTAYRLADEAAAALANDAIGITRAIEKQAYVRMLRGDKAEAIAFLKKAQGLPMAYGPTPGLIRIDPQWDPLRGEPGFEVLVTDGAIPLRTMPES